MPDPTTGDAGMATPHHTPKGRGFDTSLTYFSHGNWMYTEATWLGSYHNRSDVPLPTIIDLWDTDKPAASLNGTDYEEYIFRDRMLEILHNHHDNTPDKPLFLSYMSKLCHYPLQAPQEYQDKFRFEICRKSSSVQPPSAAHRFPFSCSSMKLHHRLDQSSRVPRHGPLFG